MPRRAESETGVPASLSSVKSGASMPAVSSVISCLLEIGHTQSNRAGGKAPADGAMSVHSKNVELAQAFVKATKGNRNRAVRTLPRCGSRRRGAAHRKRSFLEYGSGQGILAPLPEAEFRCRSTACSREKRQLQLAESIRR